MESDFLNREFWQRIYNFLPKWVQIGFWLLAGALLLFLLISGYNSHESACKENKHDEFLWCMKCFPKQIDTIWRTVYHDTCVKSNQITKISSPKISHMAIKAHEHVISGNSNTVGVNGDVTNNYNGVQQRKISSDQLSDFFKICTDKNTLIRFKAFYAADAEVLNYKNQIIRLLEENGYVNIKKDFLIEIGPPPTTLEFWPSTGGGYVFRIPPVENKN